MSRITSVPGAVKALDEIGISIKDSAGEMREFDDIIDDLGAQWQDLSAEQQQNIGINVAGRYQLSRFLIMMERYEDAIRATETATHSSGSAMRENERYLDSYEAKINKMKNAWTETTIEMQEAFLGDAIVGFTTTATGVINILTSIIEKVGLLPPLFGILGVSLTGFGGQLKKLDLLRWNSTFDQIKNNALETGKNFQTGSLGLNIYSASATTATVATNVLRGALTFLKSAILPLAIFTAIGYGISFLTEKFIENRQAAEELEKKFQELNQARVDAVTVNEEQVNSLLDTYQQLDSERPDTGFEDAEKEREYLQVQNELAELLPSIVDDIDSKGQAHLKNTEAINEEIEVSKELAQAERDMRVAEARDTYKEKIKDIDKYQQRIENLQKEIEYYESPLFGREPDADTREVIDKLEAELRLEMIKMSSMSEELSQTVLGIFDDMAYGLEQRAPQIKQIMDEVISSINFTELDLSPSEIEEVTVTLNAFANNLATLHETGNEEGFNQTIEHLNNFLSQELNVDNIDLLSLSYEDLVDIIQSGITVSEYAAQAHGENEDAMDDATESAEKLSDAQQELLDTYDGAIAKINDLNGFLNELDEGGLSAESISLIIEKHQELLPLLEDEIALREAIEEAINQQTDVASSSIMQQMEHNEEFYNHVVKMNNQLINDLNEYYDIDLRNFTSLAEAKQEIELQLLESLGSLWGQYIDGVARNASQMSNIVNDSGKLTEEGIREYQSLAGDPEAQRQAAWALASHQKRIRDMQESLDGMANITFEGLNLQAKELGSNLRNTGRSADKAGKSAKKAGDKAKKAGDKAGKAARDTAREYKLSTYVADEYANALEKVNYALERQNRLTSEFPEHSKEYRDSLRQEIKLLKDKENILNRQSKDLEKQIRSGNIRQTGIVQSGSVWEYGSSGGGSSSGGNVASYYLNDFRVSSPFGMRGGRMHKGVDLSKGRAGDPIKALRSGKVLTAAYSTTAGNWVVIQQDDGTIAKYMHMQNTPNVRAGQTVSAGQLLGKVGNTGRSFGAHLHLQIERGGTAIDPIPYLKSMSSGSSSSSSSSSSTPSAAQLKSEASRARAEQQQAIDGAKSDLLSMQQEMLSIADQIEDLYFAIVESHLAQFDHNRDRLNKKLAEVDYYQSRYDEGSNAWARQQLKREKLLRQQNKIHQNSIKWLEKEIKTNKNLTKAQRMRLDDMLIERQTEMWNLERTILDERIKMTNQLLDVYKQALDAQRDAALESVDRLLKEIDEKEREADYKKRLEKEQKSRQEILDEISQWSIDDSDAARKKIKELTEQLQEIDEAIEDMQHDKGIEDRKKALNEEKEAINERYDDLINDERAFANMRSNIIKGNTKSIGKELDSFYKKIGGMTEELGKSVVKNLQRAIKQMNTYIQDPNFKGMKIPHFDTGGMVRARSSRGGLIVAHDKEIVLKQDDTRNLLDTIHVARDLFSNLKMPKLPELAASNNTKNSILYDIDLHVENMNGTKNDARMVLNEIVRGVKSKGGKI